MLLVFVYHQWFHGIVILIHAPYFDSSGKGNLVHYLVDCNYHLECPVLKPAYFGVPILRCSRVKECISRVITKLHFVLLFDAVIFYAQISSLLRNIS
ncbi:hypothetical protein OIU79_017888 [Salix purpurea]|uniref:Uncharacterized protein n=1 Tax=Salix purpurea TaxID=77065 RepID=A0A9Q1AKR7_SALPP|nr:hypothetical protein OIU79_017888 [Salix purpurea]